MICLNIFWLCLAPYYYLVFRGFRDDNKEIAQQDIVSNFLATIADLAFVLHDWLFTEQIMMASLTMPIAIQMINKVKNH